MFCMYSELQNAFLSNHQDSRIGLALVCMSQTFHLLSARQGVSGLQVSKGQVIRKSRPSYIDPRPGHQLRGRSWCRRSGLRFPTPATNTLRRLTYQLIKTQEPKDMVDHLPEAANITLPRPFLITHIFHHFRMNNGTIARVFTVAARH